MKESKAVNVTKQKNYENQNLVYQVCTRNNVEYTDRNNFGCQYDCKKDNMLCTCRNKSSKGAKPQDMVYFSDDPKQIYSYHGSKCFTDILVGSVKALHKRKVKRVYLPETDDRGVGSSDLVSFSSRKSKWQQGSYYDNKSTSSKCIGGVQDYSGCVISEKVSPIIQKRLGTTSPNVSIDQRNIEIASNTVDMNLVTTGTQFEIVCRESEKTLEEKVKTDRKKGPPKKAVKVSEQTQMYKHSTEIHSKKRSIIERKVQQIEKVCSSDSLVQHVHNLENPSDEKRSRSSIVQMENELEREYRRIFSSKKRNSRPIINKPIPVLRSASILRRRFEALRRGLVNDGNKKIVQSSQNSVISRKDVSVTSDPPSLEGRSYTDTKKYSATQLNKEEHLNKMNYRTKKDSLQWPQNHVDIECHGVDDMIKLWGKKFNFEEEAERARPPPMPLLAIDINKKPHKKENRTNKEAESKKRGKKFYFFKSKKTIHQEKAKIKEIKKESYKPSGLTAGRCEIRDGLTIKIGNTPKEQVPKVRPKEQISKVSVGDEIQRRSWLKKFLVNTLESARSVNVRWNNRMYGTSSSTVIKLMDTIYKNNRVILKSRSEITTEASSFYRSYTENTINFVQKIEAWMIPHTIPDKPREIPVRVQSTKKKQERDTVVPTSDQRWLIDKSKALSNKIEVVLQSKNIIEVRNKVSSEYHRIDLPKYFFDVSSSNESKQNPTSDEEVYKIVEYESDLNTNKPFDKGDRASKIEVIVSLQASKNLETKIRHRRLVITSDVNIPKKCDVISMGIITQRDMKNIQKAIFKIQDNLSDDDSEEEFQQNKTCGYAESYIREYYRQWTPLGLELFSWCVSDSHLISCSEQSLISVHNQGEASKSCPNISKDLQTSTKVSASKSSSTLVYCNEFQKPAKSFTSKLYKKLRRLTKASTDTDIACKRALPKDTTYSSRFLKKVKDLAKTKIDTNIAGRREWPKDSLAVLKRRQIYTDRLMSQWNSNEGEPVSCPSTESKEPQNALVESIKPPMQSKKKKLVSNKHVSMSSANEILAQDEPSKGILAFKRHADSEACKEKEMCAKNGFVTDKKIIQISRSTLDMNKSRCEQCNFPSSNECPKRPPLKNSLSSTPHNHSSLILPQRSPKESPRPSPQTSPKKTPPYLPCMPSRRDEDTTCHQPPCNQTLSPKKIYSQKSPNCECSPCPVTNRVSCTTSPSYLDTSQQIVRMETSINTDCSYRNEIGTNMKPVTPKNFAEQQQQSSAPDEHISRKRTEDKPGVVKLNSNENITISIKQKARSTQKIKAGKQDVKLLGDDDPLCERKQYTSNQISRRPSVLGDMYIDAKVNRVSTPVFIQTNNSTKVYPKQREVVDYKSDPSLANLIEIQFQLRINQDDKTTEINIANEDEETQAKANEISKTSPEVFIIENIAKEPVEDISPNNDINIKIVVKNYKQNSDKTKQTKKNDNDDDKIYDKFHTVSTGYSDILMDQNNGNAFSIHRATIDLDYSEEKTKTLSKHCNNVSVEFTEPITSFMVLSHSIEHSATDINEEFNVEKSLSSQKYTQSYNKFDYTDTNEFETKHLDTGQDASLDLNTNNECNDVKLNSKQEKKELLKKVFEKSYTKPNKNILKVILTDSNDNDEKNAARNDLAKDVTNASVKPDYFRRTDSMNNFYNMESSLIIEDNKEASKNPYPTGKHSFILSRSSQIVQQDCICSHVGEKLDRGLKIGCYCSKQAQMDEQTSCDIRNDQDLILVNYRTAKYVDVHTQNSKHLSNKSNSINLSIYSQENHRAQNETNRVTVKQTSTNTTAKDFKEKAVKNRELKKFSPHKNHINECKMKKLNRNTMLGISDDDKIVILSKEDVRKTTARTKQKQKIEKNNLNFFKASDVLQCHATKKAVLEIYAEKTVSENGEHFVVKLPKFVHEKESEITRNYELIATNSYKSVCRRNVFRMSVES